MDSLQTLKQQHFGSRAGQRITFTRQLYAIRLQQCLTEGSFLQRQYVKLSNAYDQDQNADKKRQEQSWTHSEVRAFIRPSSVGMDPVVRSTARAKSSINLTMKQIDIHR